MTGNVRRWTQVLGVATLLQGVWAYLAPTHFFDEFPVAGARWVATLGDFNDHLMRDFGSALVGLGVIAVLAAASGTVPAVRAALVGYVAFGVPHLVYHLTTFSEFSAASFALQIGALLLFIALPIGLLVALRRQSILKGNNP